MGEMRGIVYLNGRRQDKEIKRTCMFFFFFSKKENGEIFCCVDKEGGMEKVAAHVLPSLAVEFCQVGHDIIVCPSLAVSD